MNKYEIIGIVGEGAYGVVYKAKCKETGDFFAIKKFKESEEDEIAKKTIMREVKMLRLLKYKNIVELKEAFKRKGRLYLVFEYIEKNLLEVLEDNSVGIDPKRLRLFIYQIIKGVTFCHKNNVVHRDIKPENLLINPKNNLLKICDFGFSRPLPQTFQGPKIKGGNMTDYVATRWYRSPELLLGYTEYGPEVDMWAIGCIMGELSDGQPLFPGDSEMDQLYLIQKVLGPLTEEQQICFKQNQRFNGLKFPDIQKPETLEKRYMSSLSKKALSLMSGLLSMNPSERLTGEQALLHQWFDDIRNPEDDELLLSMAPAAQRPFYSSQSRITSYNQKFNQNNPNNIVNNQNQIQTNQIVHQNVQKQNGSVSHSKDKITSFQKQQQTQSFASGSFKIQQPNDNGSGGASFNVTNKKFNQNFDNQSTGCEHQSNLQQSFQNSSQLNQNFQTGIQNSVAKEDGSSNAAQGHSSHSQGGTTNGLKIKNMKNVLSGPLRQKIKPIGSSHMEQRDKKMKDAYKNAKPKGKAGIGGILNKNFNNQAIMQYSQNNFNQNKLHFSTLYGNGNFNGATGPGSIGAGSGGSGSSIAVIQNLAGGAYGQFNFQNIQNPMNQITNGQNEISQYEYAIDGTVNKVQDGSMSQGGGQFQINVNLKNQNAAANQLIAKSKVNPMSGGIPISAILPPRNTNSELTSYQSEKKLRGMNNQNQTGGNLQFYVGQSNQMNMKLQQQKIIGVRQQNQFIIEEEGNQSQRSSDGENYSIGRSVGGVASGAKLAAQKNIKGQINQITSTQLQNSNKVKLINNNLSDNIEDSMSVQGNANNSLSVPPIVGRNINKTQPQQNLQPGTRSSINSIINGYDQITSQNELKQQQSRRQLNAENISNSTGGKGQNLQPIISSGMSGPVINSVQSSGSQSLVKVGKSLQQFHQRGTSSSNTGTFQQYPSNNKNAPQNYSQYQQPMPYQDNNTINYQANNDTFSHQSKNINHQNGVQKHLQSVNGQGPHGFFMHKVPSKVGGIQVNSAQLSNNSQMQGQSSGAVAVALPSSIQQALGANKKNLTNIAQQPHGFQSSNIGGTTSNSSNMNGYAHQLHQQQLLQQIQKSSLNHFGQSNTGGPGSKNGVRAGMANQYGASNVDPNNEFLLQSQKIIYAPPSREKSKQTVRTALILEKQKTGSVASKNAVNQFGSENNY